MKFLLDHDVPDDLSYLILQLGHDVILDWFARLPLMALCGLCLAAEFMLPPQNHCEELRHLGCS